MTASPQPIPRCEICDWPLADSQEQGCIPGDCSYRPDDPAEQQRIRRRREALSTASPQPTDGREALRQLFTRELSNERYEFVTSAPFPGWSYMKSPGESDIGMHQSFISFLATCVELEKWPTSCVEAPVPQPTSPSVDAETLKSKVIEAADEQITAIHTAFGSPGDYGYESREGKALYELYKFQVELRAAIRQSLIDETLTLSAPRVEPVAWRRTFYEIKKIALTMKSDSIQDGLGHIVRLCIDAGSPPSSSRNWTEDASHENGNYECCCVECDQPFIGHKRRVICKACSKLLSPAAPPSQPDTGVRSILGKINKLLDAVWNADERKDEVAAIVAVKNYIREALATHPAPPDTVREAADEIIGQIEARFPNWKSYRDLVDCIDCALHALRGGR